MKSLEVYEGSPFLVTLTHHHITIQVAMENAADAPTASEFMQDLVVPVMLAMQYHPDSVSDLLREE